MNLIIRTAAAKDAALIADLSRQTFFDTYAAWNTAANMDKFLQQQFTRERLMAEVGTADDIFLLAYEGDEPVGYAKLREGKIPEKLVKTQALEVARLYARTDKIGRGVGSALMQAAVQYATEKGKTVLWLVVWKENSRAVRFYEQWGFEKFDECDFVLGDDVQRDWLMKKQL